MTSKNPLSLLTSINSTPLLETLRAALKLSYQYFTCPDIPFSLGRNVIVLKKWLAIGLG